MKKARVALFDFGSVLGTTSRKRYFRKILLQEGIYRAPYESVMDYAKFLWPTFKVGAYSENVFWSKILNNTSFSDILTEDAKNRLRWDEHDTEMGRISSLKREYRKTFEVFNDMIPILQSLSLSGVVLGIISNHSVEWFGDVFEQDFLKMYFSDRSLVIVSGGVQMKKPDENIFRLAIRRLESHLSNNRCKKLRSLNEIVFIDDRIKNIEMAEQIGMRGVLFDHNKDCAKELGIKLGIDTFR